MEFIESSVTQLNWWAIFAAALSTFPVGYLWYDLKMGFGKKWMKLVGLKKSDAESMDGMPVTYTMAFVVALATAFVLACLMKTLGVVDVYDAVVFGVIFGVIVRGGAHFIHNGFARRPMELTLLDVGHDMVSIVVMTVILALWV